MLTVVCGPCCSGKTTYVQRTRLADDVVVDMDALAVALGATDGHRSTPGHRTMARLCRTVVSARLLKEPQVWDAWIIHARPSVEQVAAYERAGARLVVLDPGEQECVRRAREDKRPRWTMDAIAEWYADPVRSGQSAETVGPSRAW